jgi:hypothetical protein
MWVRVVQQLGARRSVFFAGYAAFLGWYGPRFDAITLAAARRHEYAADAAAADATSPRAIAHSLMRLELAGDWLGPVYWDAVYDRVRESQNPPTAPLAGLLETMTAYTSEGLAHWYPRATAEDALFDAHPTTQQRIAVLGVDADAQQLAFDPSFSAARRYLGDFAEEAATRIDREWHHHILPDWRKEYGAVQAAATELDALDARAEFGELTHEEELDRVALAARALGRAGAIRVFRDALTRLDDATVHFRLGCALLADGDDEGLEQLCTAIELDEDAREAACDVAMAYLRRLGRCDDAAEWSERAERSPVAG